MTKPKRAAMVVAAGALVWREREGRLEVLVIHRPRYDDWSWPKGKLDAGETSPVAAVREVAEETGLEVALGVPLPMLRYRVSGGRTKEVHYWAARELDEDSPARAARPGAPRCVDEVDDMRWLSAAQAATILTKKSDRKPLKALVALHEAGTLDTRAVAVVRHARARGRSSWSGPDANRPLTQVGEAQAEALTAVLSAFGIEAVLTSPWDRCTATVEPYARASGIVPEPVEALSEDAHRAKPAAVQRVTATAFSSPDAVALCTHRPVLPTVFAVLDRLAPAWIRRARPRKDPYLRPASVAVSHVHRSEEGPRVVGFEVQSASGARKPRVRTPGASPAAGKVPGS